jgi:hypothetical protein
VEKDLYTKYMAELYKTVESMKLRTTFPAEPIQTGLMGLIGSLKDDPGKKKESAKGYVNIEVSKGGNWGLALFLALLAVAVVFYIIRRRRRNKGKTAKKPLFR